MRTLESVLRTESGRLNVLEPSAVTVSNCQQGNCRDVCRAKLLTIITQPDAGALAAGASAKDAIDGVVCFAEINALRDGHRYYGYDEQGQGQGQQYRQRRRGSQHVYRAWASCAVRRDGTQLAFERKAGGRVGDVVIGALVEASFFLSQRVKY